MQRIQYIFLILAAMAMGTASCKKYLDIVPKGKIIPEKTADYRLLLDQVSVAGKSSGFVRSFSNDLLMSDDLQVTPFSANFYGPADQNVLSFAEHIYQDFESDPDWEALYNQIYVTNLVILQVMDSKNGTQQEKAQLLAEARVHRAYAYLTLVNLYAKHYVASSASTDAGVPLRKSLDFEEKLNRASVQEVYDLIIEDLTQALGHLPEAPSVTLNYRPVEAATNALLARTYLYMNNMPEAFKYADASLKLYNELIDYNTLPPSANFPGTLALPQGLQNKEVLLYKSVTSASSLFYADSNLMKFYDLQYDLRGTGRYASDAVFGLNFGYINSDWSGRTPTKGPSTAEMYLVRAETYARAGQTNDAINDLNTLRSFRYKTGSSYQLSAATPAEALSLVKDERRRELAFLGSRWFDIKRYNTYDNGNITVIHKLNNNTYTLPPSGARTVLPIGRKYIALNPEITQNRDKSKSKTMQKKNDLFKSLLLLLFTAISLCTQAQKKFDLNGKVNDRDGQQVQLVRDYYGNPSVLATDTIHNGQFHLSASVEEIIPVYVNIKAGKQSSSFSVILEPGKMEFVLYPSGRKAVTGGKYNKLLFGYESQPEFIRADDAMRDNQKKGLENIKDPQENYEAMQVFLKRNELRSNHLQKVFNTSRDLRARVMAAVLEELQPDRLKSMELVNQAAPVLGENSLLIQTARKMNQNQEMSINMRKGRMNGQAYIDFTAASLKGDSVQLSKLLGSNKYTLLQFWASWCVPCRYEIPLLKKLYNSNQGKGFGIVAFSLDENKIAWTKASEKENFVWSNISDLKGFNSNIIKQYQVSGIPANVIIDQQGKIVASNLVGDDLEKKIEELMK